MRQVRALGFRRVISGTGPACRTWPVDDRRVCGCLVADGTDDAMTLMAAQPGRLNYEAAASLYLFAESPPRCRWFGSAGARAYGTDPPGLMNPAGRVGYRVTLAADDAVRRNAAKEAIFNDPAALRFHLVMESPPYRSGTEPHRGSVR
jgi:hypothetical protein